MTDEVITQYIAQRGKEPLEQQFDILQKHLPSSLKEKLAVEADGENRIVMVMLADMTSSARHRCPLSCHRFPQRKSEYDVLGISRTQ